MDISTLSSGLINFGTNVLGLALDSLWFPIIRVFILFTAINLLYFIAVYLVTPVIRKAIVKLKHPLATYLLKHKLFLNLIRVFPIILAIQFSSLISNEFIESIWLLAANLLLIYHGTRLIFSVVNAIYDQLDHQKLTKNMPIQQVTQLLKVIVIAVAIILSIGVLLDKSPAYLLSGLTAVSAVILLVFRDAILGFVAGIQVAAQKLVQVGDWIVLDKDTDGEVLNISITTCKIRNWDNSISSIPAYDLINKEFKNYQQMMTTGRRLKRSINIDTDSVKFLTAEDIERMKKITLLSSLINNKQSVIEQANERIDPSSDMAQINRRNLTNIGCFRAYIKNYLYNHPDINNDAILLVRQLQSTEKGIPIEVYCFTNASGTGWVDFEELMSDIFDHLFAIIGSFDLAIYQRPSNRTFVKKYK